MVHPQEFERRFTAELMPWQLSHARHHFDQGFVDWIWRRYLPVVLSKDAAEIERWQAIQWLNKAKFGEERLDDALLQWDCYQASLFKQEDAEAARAQRHEAKDSAEFDPNSPEAQAARERTRQMLKEKGLL